MQSKYFTIPRFPTNRCETIDCNERTFWSRTGFGVGRLWQKRLFETSEDKQFLLSMPEQLFLASLIIFTESISL